MADPLAAQFDLEGMRASDLAQKKAVARQSPPPGPPGPGAGPAEAAQAAAPAAPPQAQSKEQVRRQQLAAMIQKRNLLNDRIDRYMVAAIAGTVTAILALLWFNLKLVWGQMIAKGQSRLIAPPSWRFLKVPILPDMSASAVILVIDLLVAVIVCTIVMLLIILLSMIGIAMTSYWEAVKMLFGELGSVISSLIS